MFAIAIDEVLNEMVNDKGKVKKYKGGRFIKIKENTESV